MKHYFLALFAFLAFSFSLHAQGDRKDKTAVTYEEIYDEPYSVNKLFVQIQPLYGEMFVTNVNAGFGLEASYYHKDKLDLRAGFRKAYSRGFYDFARDLAYKNSVVDNRFQVFNYFEIGGTYHVKDFESSSKTKMFLYKNSYKGNKWAARVPLNAEVPCKVRKIYGVRLGGILWNSTVDLSRALEKQGLSNADLRDTEGNSLPATYTDEAQREQQITPFSNLSSAGGYVGASMSWIKNVAVNFDKFEEGIDDLILTAYFDILVSPSISIDNIVYTDKDEYIDAGGVPNSSPNVPLQDRQTRTYSIDALRTKTFGFRAGIDGKFNRTWGWAYGGELGYRPSLEGRGFYALIKISFPVYGTNLDYKVESFGK
jgi:hypothetical protein